MSNIYEEFDEETITVHKLASAYGWTANYILNELDYKMCKNLIKLLGKLEKDQTMFLNTQEAAFYKNLLRIFPPDKEKES